MKLSLEAILNVLSSENLGLVAIHSLVLSTAPGGIKMVDLSIQTKTSTANMTGTVDRLEALGFVERRRTDPGDRRVVLVYATDKGKELVTDCRDRLEKAQKATAV